MTRIGLMSGAGGNLGPAHRHGATRPRRSGRVLDVSLLSSAAAFETAVDEGARSA